MSRSICLRIPPGEFDIGSPPSEEGHEDYEEPMRKVRITKPFYLGKYEITYAQYRAVMGDISGKVEGDTIAVNRFTYRDAVAYCEKLSDLTGVKVTLPTEAQWEYACRAGTHTRFYSGDREEDLAKAGWYSENSGGRVHPVGEKTPNAFGLYDMHGNVSELCGDMIRDFKRMDPTDPQGEVGRFGNAERGGWYGVGSQFCRSATRRSSSDRYRNAGLRIAINAE